jgi:hypothetical protein
MNVNALPILIAGLSGLLAAASAAQASVGDSEIRATFVGKAACPPEPWPVGFGPYEFRSDGVFVRMQDLASLFGRYAISDGRICVTFSGPSPPDFCLEVLKDKTQYFFRYQGSPAPSPSSAPYPVTACSLPDGAR